MLKDKNSFKWVKYGSPGELAGDELEKASRDFIFLDATYLRIRQEQKMPISLQLDWPSISPHHFWIGKAFSRLSLIATISYLPLPFVPFLSKAIMEVAMWRCVFVQLPHSGMKIIFRINLSHRGRRERTILIFSFSFLHNLLYS